MKLTSFTFFKNTPLTNFQNTILFNSNNERDNFFLNGNHYPKLVFEEPFNFIRDRQSLRLVVDYKDFSGVNYCTFISDFEPDVRYYAYVVSYNYENEKVVNVDLLIDGIMTFCQGGVIGSFKNLNITRKHMSKLEYDKRLSELKNNDDVIKTFTKRYTNEDSYIFLNFSILIQCSCDLESEFGTVDNPKIETSEGLTFDKMSAPTNLYVVESQEHFKDLMKTLAPFPWISQNIRSVSLIPYDMIEGKTINAPMKEGSFTKLKKLENGGSSVQNFLDSNLKGINKSMLDLEGMFTLHNENEKHLLRNEYTTTEIYTYDGQQLNIDNGLLNSEKGITFKSIYSTGYHNEIGIYIDGYKAEKDLKGSFLNDAIFFRNFDDIPILVDNFGLAMSKNANQRQLAESKLISNRIQDIVDPNTSLQDKFYNSASVLSNVSPMNLFSKFSDEHDFYKNQIASNKDLALETPTITAQSTNNGLQIAHDLYGIHVKYSQPEEHEWEKVKKYYKLFGFLVEDEGSSADIFTHNICDYLQCSGNIVIPNVDVSIVEMVKTQLEMGVRFWHNQNVSNPMASNIMGNHFR